MPDSDNIRYIAGFPANKSFTMVYHVDMVNRCRMKFNAFPMDKQRCPLTVSMPGTLVTVCDIDDLANFLKFIFRPGHECRFRDGR